MRKRIGEMLALLPSLWKIFRFELLSELWGGPKIHSVGSKPTLSSQQSNES
jgi:hypothetical protein